MRLSSLSGEGFVLLQLSCSRCSTSHLERVVRRWANTTGEISNILFEDIYLGNASVAIEMSANYGSAACPCKWIHPFGGPGQRGKCKTYGPPYSVGVGGNCGPLGDETNNINTRNITFRRITGAV